MRLIYGNNSCFFAFYKILSLIFHGYRSYISFIGLLLLPPARSLSQQIQRPAQLFLTKKSQFVRLGKVYSVSFILNNIDKLADRLSLGEVAMTTLPKSKVRSIGVSNFTTEHVSFTEHLQYYFICFHGINAVTCVNS